MTDIETAIMIKNMAREMVRRKTVTAKNKSVLMFKDKAVKEFDTYAEAEKEWAKIVKTLDRAKKIKTVCGITII